MSTTVKKIALNEHQPQEEGAVINKNYMGLVGNIEVNCTVRVGTLKLTIGELRQLKTNQILNLEQTTNEPVEILLNDQIIAKGELMSYENHYAIHITEVAS